MCASCVARPRTLQHSATTQALYHYEYLVSVTVGTHARHPVSSAFPESWTIGPLSWCEAIITYYCT